MEVAVSARVAIRNDLGQFRAACNAAASKTVEQAVVEGARLSSALAPIGHKHDRRTIPLAQSIEPVMLSRTQGAWVATARHALPVEYGAVPHEITPNVKFYWQEKGRFWNTGEAYPGQMIHHPGNDAQPYLRPAYKTVMGYVMEIAKRNYPG